MAMLRSSPRHRGAAAVELAFALPLILILLTGVWDVGRILEVQQLVCNAAREGARQAAIGSTLDSTSGSVQQVTASQVEQTVLNYLTRNGIDTTGADVQFANLDNPAATEPYEATNLQHLRVTCQLPLGNVRLLLVNNFVNVSLTALTGTADWNALVDINVSVPTTIPTN